MPISLEIPKSMKALQTQANQVATEVLRPISRKYDRAEHEYPKELDMLAALIDGLNDSGSGERRQRRGRLRSTARAPTRRRRRATLRGLRRHDQERRQHGDRARHRRDVLGRCRPAAVDAAPGARQLGDRRGRRRRAAEALRGQVGRDGDHRAGGRLGLGRDPHHGEARRRRVRAQRREDLRHRRRARRAGRRLGLARSRAGPRRDQVVRGRALEPRDEARSARAQARDPRLRHRGLHPRRLPRAQGGPARQPRDRHQEELRRRDEDLRQHAADGCRDGRRPDPGLPRADPRAARRGRRRDRLRRAARSPERRRGRVHRARGRLRGGPAADPAGRLDGRQQEAELAQRLLLQGEGGPHRHRRRPALRRALRRRSATARTSCSRSGPATRRSSTSSRAPSRSSCS